MVLGLMYGIMRPWCIFRLIGMIICALIENVHDMFKALKYYLYDMAEVKLTRSIYFCLK